MGDVLGITILFKGNLHSNLHLFVKKMFYGIVSHSYIIARKNSNALKCSSSFLYFQHLGKSPIKDQCINKSNSVSSKINLAVTVNNDEGYTSLSNKLGLNEFDEKV